MTPNDDAGSRQEFLQLLAQQGEEPAFVRRQRRLDAMRQQLRWELRLQYAELLKGPRIQLRRIEAIVGGHWSRLGPHLLPRDDWQRLHKLHREFNAITPPPPWASDLIWNRRPARLLHELRESLIRFNRKWIAHVKVVDLDPVNQLIKDYNRFFVLEKACAFGSEDIARRGFTPATPLTPETLLSELPTIHPPQLR